MAFDGHLGFGSRFSPEDPFILIAVLPPGNDGLRAALLDELAKIAGGSPATKIDLLIAKP